MRKMCAVLLLAIVLAFPLGCGHPTTMTSMTINPTTAGVVGTGGGGQIQFKAYGNFINPTGTREITTQVTWQSLVPEVATVDQKGLATSGTVCGVAGLVATAHTPLIGPGASNSVVTGTASFIVADPNNKGCPQTIPGD